MATRDVPAGYSAAYGRSSDQRGYEISSWIGGEYLGDVPVLSGEATVTEDGMAVSMTVESTPATRPSHAMSMLAASGQRIRVRRALMVAGEPIGWALHGWARLLPTLPAAGVLSVQGVGLRKTLDWAKFPVEKTFTAAPFPSMARSIIDGMLPLVVDGDVSVRGTKTRTWDTTRGAALSELVTAWSGVDLTVDDDGALRVSSTPTSTTPDLTMSDGPGGTVTSAEPVSLDRDPTPNAYAASTRPDDGSQPVTEVSYLTRGPNRWGGPYGQVLETFESSLLTSRAECRKAARTLLDKAQRRASTWRVRAISDDRVQLGTVLRVITDKGQVDITGRVASYTVPLTPQDEPAEYTIEALHGVTYGVDIMTGGAL